jgi:hypothetical protein
MAVILQTLDIGNIRTTYTTKNTACLARPTTAMILDANPIASAIVNSAERIVLKFYEMRG